MTCRLCLGTVDQLQSTNIFTECRREMISDLIMNFAHVKVSHDDELPKISCSTCLQHLIDIYDFKDLIVKSDAHLRSLHESSVSDDEVNCQNSSNSEEQFGDTSLQNQPLLKCECEEQTIANFVVPSIEKTDGEIKSKNECFKAVNTHNFNDSKQRMRIYKCNHCQICFKNRYQLALHKTSLTGIYPHSCDICKKGFPTKWAMTVHRCIHFKEKPFKCDHCDKSFKTKSAQITHRQIHLGVKPYECKICGKHFLRKGELKAHEFTHESQKLCVCEVCGKHFSSINNLSAHSKIHTKESTQPCPNCGKLFANLRCHIKRVHASDTIRFPCEVCGKNFSTKPVLRVHMRIHEDIKPFSCDICGKRFRQAGVANKHKRVHSGETPFHCTLCDKKFAYKHHLKKHVEKDHVKKELHLQ